MGDVLRRIAPQWLLPVHQVQAPSVPVDDEVAGVDLGVDDTGPRIGDEVPLLVTRFAGPVEHVLETVAQAGIRQFRLEVDPQQARALLVGHAQRALLVNQVIVLRLHRMRMDTGEQPGSSFQVAPVVQLFSRQVFHQQDPVLQPLPTVVHIMRTRRDPGRLEQP